MLHIFQMFHGVMLSASQLLAIESVVTGSIVYLAVLLFSPITAGFAFLGSLLGSLTGIILFLCTNLEFIECEIGAYYQAVGFQRKIFTMIFFCISFRFNAWCRY